MQYYVVTVKGSRDQFIDFVNDEGNHYWYNKTSEAWTADDRTIKEMESDFEISPVTKKFVKLQGVPEYG